MNSAIIITLQLEPYGKGRPRFNRRGHAYTPTKTRIFEQEVRRQAKLFYKGEPFKRPLKVFAQFVCSKPNKPSHSYPAKFDLDNLFKSVSDALNGVLWVDDRQICNIGLYKKYIENANEEPSILLEIEEMYR